MNFWKFYFEIIRLNSFENKKYFIPIFYYYKSVFCKIKLCLEYQKYELVSIITKFIVCWVYCFIRYRSAIEQPIIF